MRRRWPRADLAPLQHEREFALCARLAEFPELVQAAARDYAPHALAFYLKDLAGDFHSWYNAERVLVDDAADARGAPRAGAGHASGAEERTRPARCFATDEHVNPICLGVDRYEQIRQDRKGRRAHPTAPRRRKSAGGTLLGVFIGLVIGVLIAFGVVWYLNKSPLPFQNKYEGAPKAEKPAAAGNGAAAPAPLPGKPGDKPAERRFDFYNILEGKPAQGGTPPAGTPAAAPAPAAVTPPGAAASATPGGAGG
jgi:hypothetical protein